jgi:hypothetical protein
MELSKSFQKLVSTLNAADKAGDHHDHVRDESSVHVVDSASKPRLVDAVHRFGDGVTDGLVGHSDSTCGMNTSNGVPETAYILQPSRFHCNSDHVNNSATNVAALKRSRAATVPDPSRHCRDAKYTAPSTQIVPMTGQSESNLE